MSSDPNTGPPPAGWYPDGSGHLIWWDGTRWTQVRIAMARDNSRLWAVLAHLSIFAGIVVAPIAVLLTAGRSDRFVGHHAREALNAQIWAGMTFLVSGVSSFAWILTSDATDFPTWFLAVFVTVLLLLMTIIGLAIRAALQASRGVWWRYPLPFRFVPNSGPRASREHP